MIETIDRTIPDYLKKKPLWQRALPLAILVLIAVWVGMLVKDKNLLSGLMGNKSDTGTGTKVAAVEPGKINVSGKDETEKDATGTETSKSEAQTPQPAGEQNTATATEVPDPTPANSKDPVNSKDMEVAVIDPSVDAPPPPEAGDTPVPTPAEPGKSVPATPEPDEPGTPDTNPYGDTVKVPIMPPKTVKSGVEVAVAETKQPEASKVGSPTKTAPATPPGTVPAAESRPKPARYVSPEGVVLRFDDDRDGWYPLPHREFVFAGDILAVPEPFDAQVQFGTEKHRMTAIGPTLLEVVDTMNDLPLGIRVERGRLLLQPADAAPGAMPARMTLSLNVQGMTWLLELPDTGSRCGIEIVPREPRQFEEDFGAQGWSGKLFISNGSVKITTPEGKATMLTGPETYVLAPDVGSPTTAPTPSNVMPTWMADRKMSSVAKLTATQFQRVLMQDELSAHDALLPSITDRVPEKSRLATACLGLIGDFQMMLEVLDRNDHHESRDAAIDALRAWVNLQPANREKLLTEINARFAKEDASTIYRLIWGYLEQDLRGKMVSRQLVDYLEHDSLAIRELAYHYIKALTNRRLDYDARSPQNQRNAAIQQLNKVLSKDETLLPALPKGAGSTNRKN